MLAVNRDKPGFCNIFVLGNISRNVSYPFVCISRLLTKQLYSQFSLSNLMLWRIMVRPLTRMKKTMPPAIKGATTNYPFLFHCISELQPWINKYVPGSFCGCLIKSDQLLLLLNVFGIIHTQ